MCNNSKHHSIKTTLYSVTLLGMVPQNIVFGKYSIPSCGSYTYWVALKTILQPSEELRLASNLSHGSTMADHWLWSDSNSTPCTRIVLH